MADLQTRAIIFIGPPGAGKGTQAKSISSVFSIPAISSGDLLRNHYALDSSPGAAIDNRMAEGKLVSDELINLAIAGRLSEPDCENGFILDGYPRTIDQAIYLDDWLVSRGMKPPVVLHLDLDYEGVVARLTHRRHCPACGRSYGIAVGNGLATDICDSDGAKLVRRVDDNASTIHERLRVHMQVTDCLLKHYRQADYHRIEANRPAQQISHEVIQILLRRTSADGNLRSHGAARRDRHPAPRAKAIAPATSSIDQAALSKNKSKSADRAARG